MSDAEVRTTTTNQATNDLLKEGGWRLVTVLIDPKTSQCFYVLAREEDRGMYPGGWGG